VSAIETEPGGESAWARLTELSSEPEAQLIQGYLESAGIPCQIESLAFRAEPLTFGPLARVRLWVLRGHLTSARQLLREAQDAAARAADLQATDDPSGAGDSAEEDY
jgi:hypothetical protein